MPGFALPLTNPTPDEVAFKVLRTALANGANVWNGADFYGTPAANSLHLMNRYFTKYPEDSDKVVLCIKSGIVDMRNFQLDGSPEHMRKMVDQCNRILDGKKVLDVFGMARTDPNTPIEVTVKGLGQLVKEGKINGIQLSEARADTIRRAAKVHEIAMVEEEVSLWSPEVFSNGVAETCAELGIAIVAHTPLGAGMLTGQIDSLDDLPKDDHRHRFPRWQPDAFQKNLDLVRGIKKLAAAKGCTTAQLALAWVKSHNGKANMPVIVPIAGARSETRVVENCTDVPLSEEDLLRINEILANSSVEGARFPEAAAKLNEY